MLEKAMLSVHSNQSSSLVFSIFVILVGEPGRCLNDLRKFSKQELTFTSFKIHIQARYALKKAPPPYRSVRRRCLILRYQIDICHICLVVGQRLKTVFKELSVADKGSVLLCDHHKVDRVGSLGIVIIL